jgi:hypothetical protein
VAEIFIVAQGLVFLGLKGFVEMAAAGFLASQGIDIISSANSRKSATRPALSGSG